nr:MAG TPA: glycosyltransferase [Caudoviricetes sp.]
MRHRPKGVGASFRVSVLQKTGCFYIREDLICLQ